MRLRCCEQAVPHEQGGEMGSLGYRDRIAGVMSVRPLPCGDCDP